MNGDAATQRRAELISYLELRSRNSRKWRHRNSYVAVLLMTTAIISSVAGGIGGLATLLSTQTVGAIALIPGACALLANQIKFDRRAILNRRRQRLFEALLNRVKFQLPEPPTLDQLAVISQEITRIDNDIDREVEETITMGWSWLHGTSDKK